MTGNSALWRPATLLWKRSAQPATTMTCNLGIIERLGGIETGHRELPDWIERWISR
jgi:hypothetical protein